LTLLADKKLPPNEPTMSDVRWQPHRGINNSGANYHCEIYQKNVLTGPESFAFFPVFATLNA